MQDGPQDLYRNRFLVDAMVNLNMIDTIGSGIKRSFGIQRDRNFPMPTYDLSEKGRVKVRVIGQIIDPNYTRMLMSQTDLSLLDVIALDKVQKGVALSDDDFRSLKSKDLIEGHRPNVYVSADVAKATHMARGQPHVGSCVKSSNSFCNQVNYMNGKHTGLSQVIATQRLANGVKSDKISLVTPWLHPGHIH